MCKCLKRNKNFLHDLLKDETKLGNEDERKQLTDNASNDEIRCLSEIARNIISGKFKIPDEVHIDLLPHKHLIRKLSKKTLSHKIKKTVLKQKGGFLPFLISPVLSALGVVVGRLVSSHLGL